MTHADAITVGLIVIGNLSVQIGILMSLFAIMSELKTLNKRFRGGGP